MGWSPGRSLAAGPIPGFHPVELVGEVGVDHQQQEADQGKQPKPAPGKEARNQQIGVEVVVSDQKTIHPQEQYGSMPHSHVIKRHEQKKKQQESPQIREWITILTGFSFIG